MMQKNRSRRKSSPGFILIELMLVVSIIGILAAVAIPAYQNYVLRAKAAEWQIMIAPIKQGISHYFDYWGRLPANNQAAGLPEGKVYHSKYVDAMEIRDGAVIVTLPTKELRLDKGGSIVFFPVLSTDKIERIVNWICYSGSPPADLLAYKNLPTVEPLPELFWKACMWPKK